MIKVLIVDDHTSVREAFKAIFEEKDDFCVVGESANANDCVLLCERLSPDIVLLDVCTEGYSSGLVATENIKQNFRFWMMWMTGSIMGEPLLKSQT